MKEFVWSIPLFPLLASLVLMLVADRISHRGAAVIGCASVGLSALAVLALAWGWITGPPATESVSSVAWQWFAVDPLTVTAVLRVDPLALVMAFVVTFVGFFIHLYSVEYMAGEEGYARYFAWLNLFVGAMLLLVMADDLLLLYLGWEGVGLCSYLLIGFWYRDPVNGYAARKAFIMTRAGDTLLLLALIYLATRFHTLRIDEIVNQARDVWLPGAPAVTVVTLFLLGGAVGKSAQVPLQAWLPDAMAGPTPVSALIHAATMVTAGVYLIARLHGLFAMAPVTLTVIGIIGAVTLLVGGFSALAQTDIKRVLAWSTISQIGYMFLALGLGAWSAAIFHLFTHAFFKALLFLAAGGVILGAGHEQEMGRIGGLRRSLPLVFWSFVAGGASLAALPLVTAGFFSKEQILAEAWRAPALWAAGIVGAVVTAAYVTRLIVGTFFTTPEIKPYHRPHIALGLPLVVLSIGAVAAGWLEWPEWGGAPHLITDWLAPLFGEHATRIPPGATLVALAAPFVGVLLWWWLREQAVPGSGGALRLWREGWRFDALYGFLFEGPWIRLARRGAGEVVDRIYESIEVLLARSWDLLSELHNGAVRRYLLGLAIGALLLLAVTL